MSRYGLAYDAELSVDIPFESPQWHSIVSSESDLEFTRGRLAAALAREKALLRENGAMTRRLEMLNALLMTGANASVRFDSLTSRERQVLHLVLDGHPNKLIAVEMGLSQRTVESYRAAVMKKTGVHSLPELARLAVAAACERNGEVPNHGQQELRRAG